ncbi:MAG: response regulator [Pseudomonadales bacterium]|nr:response regulator [Pseudomonadales bacterium]
MTKSEEILFDFDQDNLCIYLSDHAKDVFGDQTGKHIFDVFAEYPEVLEQFNRVINGREQAEFDVGNRQRWNIQGIFDDDDKLFQGVVVEVTFLEPETPEEPLPTLLPSTWVVEVADRELHISAAFARTFGLPSTRISFDVLNETFPEEVKELTQAAMHLLDGTHEFFFKEIKLTDARGNTRWLSVRGQPSSREKGSIPRINGSVEDITQKLLELRQKQEQDSKLLRVQKMEAIGELVGGIAHDFNNILSSIIGYTELAMMEAAESQQNPKLMTYLTEVFQGSKRARELVSKMQTFSRADQVRPENLDLMQEVKEIVKMLRASLPSSIEIRIDIEESLPEIFIDKTFLQQIIMNACINARDAMQETGTIFIRGHNRQVSRDHCSSCHELFAGEYVELSIEDTGSGIPSAIADRIFEPYVSGKASGSGMGLAMVHGIMHRQGGHIKVDTIPGDGTEFRFFFKPSEHAETSLESPNTSIVMDADNAARHILVIDDEVSLVYYLRELLHKRGYQVSVASDSHEAWDMFSAAPDKFDLVVTDQTMPGLSGVQLAAKMLTLREDLPIILCTGYSDVVEEGNISQYGIKGFMSKPIDSRQLLRSIQSLLAGG